MDILLEIKAIKISVTSWFSFKTNPIAEQDFFTTKFSLVDTENNPLRENTTYNVAFRPYWRNPTSGNKKA